MMQIQPPQPEAEETEKQIYQMIRLMPRLKWNREPMWAKNLRKKKDKVDVEIQVLETLAWLGCRESEIGHSGKPKSEEEEDEEGGPGIFDKCNVPNEIVESYEIDGMDLVMWRPIKIYRDALITMVMKAFNRHHPIVLSPDLVYAYLAKGISLHIKMHEDKLSKLYVNHTDARHMLRYENEAFVKGKQDNDWGDMFRAFAYEIRDQVQGTSVVPGDLMFSTTSPVAEAHRQVLTMDTMQHYFKFKANTKCGIAAVILEGTVEDWELLRKTICDQFKEINDYARTIRCDEADLSWWSQFVVEMLDNMVDSYKQQAEADDVAKDLRQWWNKLYKYHGALESGVVGGATGWVNLFYPYLTDNQPNPWIMYCLDNQMDVTLKVRPPPGVFSSMCSSGTRGGERPEWEIDLNRYPSYLNCIPFRWNYYQEELEMKALIGHSMLGMVTMDYREYPFGTMKLFPMWAIIHDARNVQANAENDKE